MKTLENIFGVSKPIIGMVHLLPLPGSPRYDGRGLEPILERATFDAKALKEGGIDGLLIENYGDAPYKPTTTDPETIASMAVIAREIAKPTGLVVGVNVLRNSALSALAVCLAAGGRFIRVNVLTEALITDQGILQGCAHDLLRFRKNVSAEGIKIFADIHTKHAAPMIERSIEDSARDAAYRGMADAIIITGPRTGSEPDFNALRIAKQAVPDRPIIIGSGLNRNNASPLLRVADGAIVGTSLKQGATTDGPVDRDRVREIINIVKNLR